MSACEKCWGDARRRAAYTDTSTAEAYEQILEERKDAPCTPREQAGRFWDEQRHIDTRDEMDPAE